MVGGRIGTAGPFILGFLAGVALVAGVIFVHGFPAKELIYGGSAAIIAASLWNVIVRKVTIKGVLDATAESGVAG